MVKKSEVFSSILMWKLVFSTEKSMEFTIDFLALTYIHLAGICDILYAILHFLRRGSDL